MDYQPTNKGKKFFLTFARPHSKVEDMVKREKKKKSNSKKINNWGAYFCYYSLHTVYGG